MDILETKKIIDLIKNKKLDKFQNEIIDEIEKSVSDLVNEKIKKYKNKNRVVKNDDQKEHISAIDVLSKKQIDNLPSWVRKNIKNASLVGETRSVIQTQDGKKYHIKNTLNDLSGGEWTYFLNSVINTRYVTSGEDAYAHHIRKMHPSPKPPQLMEEIIKFFTKEKEIVFDYFMGVGGTLLGASLCNRRAIGIDLEKKYIDAYKEANKFLKLKEQASLQGDSIKILRSPSSLKKILKDEQFSLILIDPPYGDMMARKKTGETLKQGRDNSATPFTNSKDDLGNMNWQDFRKIFKESVTNAIDLLKNKGHLVVFIKDLQPDNKGLNLLHSDLIYDISGIKNMKYLGTKIWADQGVNLYPYGYPYSYVSNQIHQYILIFKKEK